MDRVSQLREDWRIARSAHRDLLTLGPPRVNMFLMGGDGVVSNLLQLLEPDLPRPQTVWTPNMRLVLPPSHASGTIILRNVGALMREDQARLYAWLGQDDRRAQVVSTSAASLVPNVEAGTFIEQLLYRLNTICLDLNT